MIIQLLVGSSTQAKAQKETKAAPKVLAKTHKRGNAGKLAKLIDMPLDVFFEVSSLLSFASYNATFISCHDRPQITSKLKPVDILQLSRVSKDFRSMFMSRGSRHVWVAARRNIPSLPKCPDDLSMTAYCFRGTDVYVIFRSCRRGPVCLLVVWEELPCELCFFCAGVICQDPD